MDSTLLHKYLLGQATVSERVAVHRWIQEDEAHLKEFNKQRRLYDEMIWHQEEIVEGLSHKRKHLLRRFVVEGSKLAAALVIGFLLSYFITLERDTGKMQSVHVPPGQRAELALADGTHVWLNANSTLTYPANFSGDKRQVHLEGEAYFDVAKDKDCPFDVIAKDYTIEVLGTQFNVTAYPNQDFYRASLLEGSISLSTPNDQKLMLEPNTEVLVRDQRLVKRTIRDYDHFLWRKGIIHLDKRSLRLLFSDMQLYYDVHINIDENHEMLDHKFSGKFRVSDGIEHALKVLQLHMPFTYTISEDRRTININP